MLHVRKRAVTNKRTFCSKQKQDFEILKVYIYVTILAKSSTTLNDQDLLREHSRNIELNTSSHLVLKSHFLDIPNLKVSDNPHHFFD